MENEALEFIDKQVEESKTEMPSPERKEMDFNEPKSSKDSINVPKTTSPTQNKTGNYYKLESPKITNTDAYLTAPVVKALEKGEGRSLENNELRSIVKGIADKNPNMKPKEFEKMLLNYKKSTSQPKSMNEDALKVLKSSLTEKEWNSIKDNKDYIDGYLSGKYQPKERESLKEEAKEFNAPKKHDYSQIFDEDYQRSYGIPKFEDETDIKKLNDIVEKAMEYDGEEGAIDISNNAMERIGELTSFTEEEQDKLANGTGEEIMDILRSKEKKNSFNDKIVYPKGTSKEYTEKVNAEYKKALPILEKYGIKLEDFGGHTNDRGGYEDNSKEIMDKYVFEPFRKKYPNGNNAIWEREYKPLYEAIDAVLDKNYNDWWIRNK